MSYCELSRQAVSAVVCESGTQVFFSISRAVSTVNSVSLVASAVRSICLAVSTVNSISRAVSYPTGQPPSPSRLSNSSVSYFPTLFVIGMATDESTGPLFTPEQCAWLHETFGVQQPPAGDVVAATTQPSEETPPASSGE